MQSLYALQDCGAIVGDNRLAFRGLDLDSTELFADLGLARPRYHFIHSSWSQGCPDGIANG